jgi:hypothetical protein
VRISAIPLPFCHCQRASYEKKDLAPTAQLRAAARTHLDTVRNLLVVRVLGVIGVGHAPLVHAELGVS